MLETPRGNRLHIALFGRRNAGKSSLINALTNQSLAIVSAVAGTTTDPVYKSMEILPIGPVVVIDTAGLDDVGDLGRLRIAKSLEVLRKSDLVLLVVDAVFSVGQPEQDLAARCAEQKIPFILVTHDPEEALAMGTQVFFIEKGCQVERPDLFSCLKNRY